MQQSARQSICSTCSARFVRPARFAVLPLALVALLAGCGPATDPDFAANLQQRLIEAQPGDVIEVPAGVHEFNRGLSLTVDGVTLRGQGMDDSVLSFRGQLQGAEGLLVSANDFTIEDLAIEDTVGDALKISDSENVTVRRVRTEWTGGPAEDNGAYGIYPVQSRNVLIEGSVAIGASDAGIYVGQSSRIIVRDSRAEFNVAGIEIENSTFADVHGNTAVNNTGGILVFDLPDLPVQGGRNTRVFDNDIRDNNTPNFAPEGNIVATVPAGSGLMILANDNIEVFGNRFADNETANVMIVSYHITGLAVDDPNYDAFPEAIHIHGNSFSGGGSQPDAVELQALQSITGAAVPHIVWDGTALPGRGPTDILCIADNQTDEAPLFVNLDTPNGFANPSFDPTSHGCTMDNLEAVSLESAATTDSGQ